MSAGSTDCQRLVIMKLSVRAWKESRPGNVGRRTSLRKNRDEGCFHGYQLEANSPRGNPVLCLWRKMLTLWPARSRSRRANDVVVLSSRLDDCPIKGEHGTVKSGTRVTMCSFIDRERDSLDRPVSL